ncbi:MAG: sigma factor [Acidimicrobiales bacterium]
MRARQRRRRTFAGARRNRDGTPRPFVRAGGRAPAQPCRDPAHAAPPGPRRGGRPCGDGTGVAAEEAALLAEAAGGDRDEPLEELFRRYAGRLYALGLGLGLGILGDSGLAEELVQESFVRLWRQAPRFDPARGTVAAFVFAPLPSDRRRPVAAALLPAPHRLSIPSPTPTSPATCWAHSTLSRRKTSPPASPSARAARTRWPRWPPAGAARSRHAGPRAAPASGAAGRRRHRAGGAG